jgi:hypothetical protein
VGEGEGLAVTIWFISGFRRIAPLLDLIADTDHEALHPSRLRSFFSRVTGFLKAGVVHCVGGGGSWRFAILLRFLRLLGKKIVIQWIGTDVMALSKAPKPVCRSIAGLADAHVADLGKLADELKKMGIRAGVLPLPVELPAGAVRPGRIRKLEKILTYIPEGREEFYRASEHLKVWKKFPGVMFLVAGHRGGGPFFREAPTSVRFLGVTDGIPEIVWNSVQAYVRLTAHDGLSLMVIEALARGKQVVWNTAYPGCLFAADAAGVAKKVKTFLTSGIGFNLKGRDAVLRMFEPSALRKRYLGLYGDLA